MPLSPRKLKVVSLTLEGGQVAKLPLAFDTSLWDMLRSFEEHLGCNITALHGVPKPEKNALFELTINIPGYMQPVVTCLASNQVFDTLY